MVATLPILSIMPFDLVSGEVAESTFADAGEEILFGIWQGQAEGTVFGFVISILPGFRGEGVGGLFEGGLVWLFGFEEFGHEYLSII